MRSTSKPPRSGKVKVVCAPPGSELTLMFRVDMRISETSLSPSASISAENFPDLRVPTDIVGNKTSTTDVISSGSLVVNCMWDVMGTCRSAIFYVPLLARARSMRGSNASMENASYDQRGMKYAKLNINYSFIEYSRTYYGPARRHACLHPCRSDR